MNTANITGRITRDLELKHTQDGKAVLKFSVAVNRKFKKDEADFIYCTAWGKTAEIMEQYLNKGDMVGVSGSIRTGSYDGECEKVYTFEVVVESFDFLQSKAKGNPVVDNKKPMAAKVEDEDFPF